MRDKAFPRLASLVSEGVTTGDQGARPRHRDEAKQLRVARRSMKRDRRAHDSLAAHALPPACGAWRRLFDSLSRQSGGARRTRDAVKRFETIGSAAQTAARVRTRPCTRVACKVSRHHSRNGQRRLAAERARVRRSSEYTSERYRGQAAACTAPCCFRSVLALRETRLPPIAHCRGGFDRTRRCNPCTSPRVVVLMLSMGTLFRRRGEALRGSR